MPNLCNVFSQYSYISNFKINYNKSEELNLTLREATLNNTKNNCKFKWETTSLTYLGIQLTPKLDSMYKANFQPLLKNITKDLEKWTMKYFSWFGRAAIIKMTVLPRILYFFQTVPIILPSSCFKSLHFLLRKFLWNSKKPRISLNLLTMNKQNGGSGFHNFTFLK